MQLKLLSTMLFSIFIIGCGGGGGDTVNNSAESILLGNSYYYTDEHLDFEDGYYTNYFGVDSLRHTEHMPDSTVIDQWTEVIPISYSGTTVIITDEGITQSCEVRRGENYITITCPSRPTFVLWDTIEDAKGSTKPTTPSTGTIILSGKITYDLVPANSNYIGLDYDNIRQEAVKGAQVDAIDSSNQSVASTITDDMGNYTVSLPNNTAIKIRVLAKTVKSDTATWDVKVIDNTNNNALYVMEGPLSSTGTSNVTRNLNASSGWDGSSYSSSRVAAPFAILDNAYKSIQKVLTADPDSVFPPLLINWSIYNVSISGDTSLGQITTSHYNNSNLFILGDANSDTDEYDDHIITHEWGHYYEDKLSRSDSIGGPHGPGELLDIRVAFSEGFGNAFSGMVLDAPVYFDTMGANQANGFSFDMESEAQNNPGWYSEASVQRILYDLYDDNSDGSDTLSFGFAPLHTIFTGTQKTTTAFTSIFSFITLLKNENVGNASEIDSLVLSENIATITDIYGNDRSNTPYHEYGTLGSDLSIVISNTDGSYNKLSNRQYVKFNIVSSGIYTIKVDQTNGADSDPDFYVFDTSPFSRVDFSEGTVSGLEEKDVSLSAGEYLLDISEYNNINNAQLDVSITLK